MENGNGLALKNGKNGKHINGNGVKKNGHHHYDHKANGETHMQVSFSLDCWVKIILYSDILLLVYSGQSLILYVVLLRPLVAITIVQSPKFYCTLIVYGHIHGVPMKIETESKLSIYSLSENHKRSLKRHLYW